MKVEIWSDIICPFCYIGKRHFEKALEKLDEKNNIELVWKSYQLNPNIPMETDTQENVYEYLAHHKGISYEESVQLHEHVVAMAKTAGLDYQFDKAVMANSFKAHRMIQYAKMKGLGDKAEECFFYAYFTEGKNINEESTLITLGQEIGLTEMEAKEALTNDEYASKVRQDIREAQAIGVKGVPFFVFNRKYAISGAQPSEVFLDVLKKSVEEWKKNDPDASVEVSDGPACGPDGACD